MAGRKWTDEEVEYLKEHYGDDGAEGIAHVLNRTKSSVQTKARELDLTDDQARGLWTEDDEAFLRENYLELGAEECARRLGRSKASVHGKIRKIGGGRPSIGPKVEWTEQELDFLRDNYHQLTWEEMVDQLGRTEQAIQVRASMLGLQRYVDPYTFFETWTEQSAYVIGFFAADGWVSKRGPESIRIGFGQKDADILYSIRDAVGVGDVYPGRNRMFRYYIQSTRAYERLCDIFGMDVCKKSHTIRWPDIPDDYVRHFLRGAVDGDGSLFWRSQDGLWSFGYTTSSKHFADALAMHVERLTGVHTNSGPGNHQSWQVRCTGIKAVCLADWLYREATIALKRKSDIAHEMMESTGLAQPYSITPKMREMFPHILERYEIVESVGQ